MDSLHFQGIKRYHQCPLESHPGTFDWIFDQQSRLHRCDFTMDQQHGECATEQECHQVENDLRKHTTKLRMWLETSGDIFWVNGKAGSGKSTFMKFLLEHDQTQVCLRRWSNGNVIMAAFFFWGSSSSELERSYIRLLRALLHQILLECPELIRHVLPEHWQAASRSIAYRKPWTKNALLAAFALLLDAAQPSTRFCFLIDGLDEFDGDLHDLNDAIRCLNRSPVIKICVSSRPWNIFQQAYGFNDDLHIALHSLTKRDIDQYVRARPSLSIPTTLGESELRQLGDTLCGKAKGVFLWVTLAVRDLRRGLGDHDSSEMLQSRLNEYPTELREFLEHIFDKIDPFYKKLSGRVLLMMLALDWGLPLVSVPFLEDYTSNEDIITGAQMSAKSHADMHKLVDRAILCANTWCRDMTQPINAQAVHDATSKYLCGPSGKHRSEYHKTFFTIGGYLTFGHRAIHQFVKQKADDGTLAEMSGRNFSPHLAALCTSVGVSRYALEVCDFAAHFEYALQLSRAMHCPVSLSRADFVKQIDGWLMAIEATGQAIEKHMERSHWTACQLAEKEEGGLRHEKYIDRAPSSREYTSLVSYCISLSESSSFILDVAMEQLYESLSSEQKQFVLETVLLPQYYQGRQASDELNTIAHAPTWHCHIVAKVLSSGIDVNRPTPRSGCRTDYSVWQFYLLWVHDWFHKFDLEGEDDAFDDEMMRDDRRDELEFLTNIFRLFLQSGADPFAVISSEDLIECYDDYSYEEGTFLSVADILEDTRTVALPSAVAPNRSTEWIAVWEGAFGALEKALQEAFAQKDAASPSELPSS
jgi:hypothetical protein